MFSVLGWGSGGSGVVLVYDTFTDTNGTALDAHTPDIDRSGSGWTEQHFSFDITSNKATMDVGGDTQPQGLASIPTTAADVVIETVAQTSDNGSSSAFGIALRYSDNNNYWLLDVVPVSDTARMFEVNGGSYTSRGTSSPTIDINTDYTLKAIASDQTIIFTVDGGDTVTYTSASHNESQTTHGIRGGNQADTGAWDWFKVSTL